MVAQENENTKKKNKLNYKQKSKPSIAVTSCA
jgi:hypothetical protein